MRQRSRAYSNVKNELGLLDVLKASLARRLRLIGDDQRSATGPDICQMLQDAGGQRAVEFNAGAQVFGPSNDARGAEQCGGANDYAGAAIQRLVRSRDTASLG